MEKKWILMVLAVLLLIESGRTAKFLASDGESDDSFGESVSLSNQMILVGAPNDDDYASYFGSVYLYRELDMEMDPATESARLLASDGAAYDGFGTSVSLSGSMGLVSGPGKVYLYRNLDIATGTVFENAWLTSSSGTTDDLFGSAVSLSDSMALVGAPGDRSYTGAAYVYRNLDTATGTVTEDAKLIASDGAKGDYFGSSVSLSGSAGLIGAYASAGAGKRSGAAYVFRNLDTATGTVTEDAKLIASDGARGDSFGSSVSLSGSTGLIGAYEGDGANKRSGAAYLFRNLDAVSGTVTEDVKLIASSGAMGDCFGSSVSLDGDRFAIGAKSADGAAAGSGAVYYGSVKSVTTIDDGTAETISGISFESRLDWIIGEVDDGSSVILSAGDSANITADGKAVYIGKEVGSDDNDLFMLGIMSTSAIHIGTDGNFGNSLWLADTSDFTAVDFFIWPQTTT